MNVLLLALENFMRKYQKFHNLLSIKDVLLTKLSSRCADLKVEPSSRSNPPRSPPPPPPRFVPEINQGSAIAFTNSFGEGFDAKWNFGMLSVVEKAFLGLLCRQVTTIIEYTGGRHHADQQLHQQRRAGLQGEAG